MKIESIAVCRFNGDTAEPVLLDIAHNMAEYGFFQKGPAKEFLNFATRTLAKRLAGEEEGGGAVAVVCARMPPPRCCRPSLLLLCDVADAAAAAGAFLATSRRNLLARAPLQPACTASSTKASCALRSSSPRCVRTRLRAAAARRPLAVTTQPCRPLPPQGLSAIAVCDKEYPSRVALSMLKDLVNEMKTGEHACVCCMRARARVARARAPHSPPPPPPAPSAPSGAARRSRARARWRG
jgi:hypothetical protein